MTQVLVGKPHRIRWEYEDHWGWMQPCAFWVDGAAGLMPLRQWQELLMFRDFVMTDDEEREIRQLVKDGADKVEVLRGSRYANRMREMMSLNPGYCHIWQVSVRGFRDRFRSCVILGSRDGGLVELPWYEYRLKPMILRFVCHVVNVLNVRAVSWRTER